MKNILPPVLKEKIIEVLSKHSLFSYEGNKLPFYVKLGDKEFNIYVKNISSACFPQSPDITRVQLPNLDVFDNISISSIPFLLFGYDQINDVIVCWNPNGLKERLNSSRNVSLYSRQSYQNEVQIHEFKNVYLTNGDKIIMFKRINLLNFMFQFDALFKNDGDSVPVEIIRTKFDSETKGKGKIKITEITDVNLIKQITPMLLGYHTFQALPIVMNYYEKEFPEMTIKDWTPLVMNLKEKLLKEVNN